MLLFVTTACTDLYVASLFYTTIFLSSEADMGISLGSSVYVCVFLSLVAVFFYSSILLSHGAVFFYLSVGV